MNANLRPAGIPDNGIRAGLDLLPKGF